MVLQTHLLRECVINGRMADPLGLEGGLCIIWGNSNHVYCGGLCVFVACVVPEFDALGDSHLHEKSKETIRSKTNTNDHHIS